MSHERSALSFLRSWQRTGGLYSFHSILNQAFTDPRDVRPTSRYQLSFCGASLTLDGFREICLDATDLAIAVEFHNYLNDRYHGLRETSDATQTQSMVHLSKKACLVSISPTDTHMQRTLFQSRRLGKINSRTRLSATSDG